jgi:cytochrome c-type biogenesis protein CcmH/NrfG
MSARIGVAVMAALLVLYIVLVGQRAWLLLTSGEGIGVALGVALIVMPILAVWALGRELWFGVRAERLGRRLESDGALPAESVAVRPSGRVVREDADAVFPAYRAEVEAHPEDWHAWYRLGLAYDAAGDRRRARESVRTAIRLEATDRRAQAG